MEIKLHVERQKEEIAKAGAAQGRYRHDLENTRAHAETANEDLRRARELYKRELISKQKLTHAETEFRQAKAQVSSLEEKVKEGEAALGLVRVRGKEIGLKKAALRARHAEVQHAKELLANFKRRLELTTIRSPVWGRVAKREIQQGEFVQPGQPLFMVVDTTDYWVEANVEETKIRFVRPGSKAIVRVDSYPGHDFSGRVLEVGEATVSAFSLFSPARLTGVFVKSTQRLPVRIAVENNNGKLKVGMLAVVWIEKDSH
jgi:membrane fusion protein (multidrug efflux system)